MSEKPDQFSRRDFLRGKILGRFVDVSTRGLQSKGEQIAKAAAHYAAPAHAIEPARETPRQQLRRSFPVIRPPGAVDEATFLEKCTRCGDCIAACPHDVITLAPASFRNAAGSPMINAADAPCLMCEDFPCIDVCPEDVLLPLETGHKHKIADARILDYNCLNRHGRAAEHCMICIEQCPEEGALIVEDGMPRVDNDKCSGCGICHYACPAPTNAVAMMPLQERPVVLTIGVSPDDE
ncbi:MAG: quinol dehydrogenase [Phycisphaeraceae bacterium]|nr:quinol dehydrogenase [Phycisphaeraceae bacterium]